MVIKTLPTKQELLTSIFSDAISREEAPNKAAWDEAIQYGVEEYADDFALEEMVACESNIKDSLFGFMQGYLQALEK